MSILCPHYHILFIVIFSILLFFTGCTPEPEIELISLNILITGEGETYPSDGVHYFETNDYITIDAIAYDGWIFDHWIGPVEQPGQQTTKVQLVSDITITAVFVTELSYTQEVEDFSVEFGTNSEIILSELPTAVTITDSAGRTHYITVTWDLVDYLPQQAGIYLAQGYFLLPNDIITGDIIPEQSIDCTVTVLPLPISGKVVDEETGLGIENIEIQFDGSEESVFSDVHGQWSQNLDSIPVRITPKHDNYQFSPNFIDFSGLSDPVQFSAYQVPAVTEVPDLQTIEMLFGISIDDILMILPDSISVTIDSGENIEVLIDWVADNQYQIGKAGLFDFSGYLHSQDSNGNPINIPENFAEIIQPVVIGKGSATILLTNMIQIFNAEEHTIDVSTIPEGLSYSVTYDDSISPPVNVGTYEVKVSINDDNYQGTVESQLIIDKAEAQISLIDSEYAYTGTTPALIIETIPSQLEYEIRYDGEVRNPVYPGQYDIQIEILDTNYYGILHDTIEITKAEADILVQDTCHVFDGNQKHISISTYPSDLSYTVSYGLEDHIPINAGSYTYSVQIEDSNYRGNATGTMLIEKAEGSLFFENLVQVADGTPKEVSVTTTPLGLPFTLTYNDASTPPSLPGTYTVKAILNDENYQGEMVSEFVLQITAVSNLALDPITIITPIDSDDLSGILTERNPTVSLILSDNSIVEVPVVWDNVPHINSSGTYEINGRLALSSSYAMSDDLSIKVTIYALEGTANYSGKTNLLSYVYDNYYLSINTSGINADSIVLSSSPKGVLPRDLNIEGNAIESEIKVGEGSQSLEITLFKGETQLGNTVMLSLQPEDYLTIDTFQRTRFAPLLPLVEYYAEFTVRNPFIKTIIVRGTYDDTEQLFSINEAVSEYPVKLTLDPLRLHENETKIIVEGINSDDEVLYHTELIEPFESNLLEFPVTLEQCIYLQQVPLLPIVQYQVELMVHDERATSLRFIGTVDDVSPISSTIEPINGEDSIVVDMKMHIDESKVIVEVLDATDIVLQTIVIEDELQHREFLQTDAIIVNNFTFSQLIPLFSIAEYSMDLTINDPKIISVVIKGEYDDTEQVFPIQWFATDSPLQFTIDTLRLHASETKVTLEGIGYDEEVLYQTEIVEPFSSNHPEFPITFNHCTYTQKVPLLPLVEYQMEFTVHDKRATTLLFQGNVDDIAPYSIALEHTELDESFVVDVTMHMDESIIYVDVLDAHGVSIQTFEIEEELNHTPTSSVEPITITNFDYSSSVPLFPLDNYQLTYIRNSVEGYEIVFSGTEDSVSPQRVMIYDSNLGVTSSIDVRISDKESDLTAYILDLHGNVIQQISLSDSLYDHEYENVFTFDEVIVAKEMPLFPLIEYQIGITVNNPLVTHLMFSGLNDIAVPNQYPVSIVNLGNEITYSIMLHKDESLLQVIACDADGRAMKTVHIPIASQ